VAQQALTKEQRNALRASWARVCFRGTPEKFYTDSGFWEFVQYCKTFDSHDPGNPVKQFPYWEPYVQACFLHMLNCRQLLIPKSRQIKVSWMLSIFACWWARTAPYQLIGIQSKKAEDAEEIVSKGDQNPQAGRIDFIEQNLPEWLRDPHIFCGKGNRVGELIYTPSKSAKTGGIVPPWYGSRIVAMPQGAGQARSKTYSLFMSDEAAIQEEFEEAVIALLATLDAHEDSTKFIAASSVWEGSYFNKMCLESHNDSLEVFEDSGIERLAGLYEMMPGEQLPKGVSSRETPSGFDVLQVHYYADPLKDPSTPEGREWVERASKRYGGVTPTGWRREYEIDYSSSGGVLLFPYLNATSPILIPAMSYKEIKDKDLALYAGFDYGINHPSAFEAWGVGPDGRRYALWEVHEKCRSIPHMAAKIKACPYFSEIKYIKCDPSIVNQKTQHSAGGLRSIAEMFADEGVVMSPGRKGADIGFYNQLEYAWRDRSKPEWFITAGCPKLWRELQLLKWKEHASERVKLNRAEPDEIVDKNNDGFDASAYVNDSKPSPVRRRRSTQFEDFKAEIKQRNRDKELEKYYVGSA
jgi:hypothetical protein